MGEPSIPESGNSMTENSDGDENKISLISLHIGGNTSTGGILKNIQTFDEEQRGRKVNSQRDSDITSDKRPTTHPSRGATTPGWREGKSLVIDTTSSGIYRGDFS